MRAFFNVTSRLFVVYPQWLAYAGLAVVLVLCALLIRRETRPARGVARVWEGALFAVLLAFITFLAITLINGLLHQTDRKGPVRRRRRPACRLQLSDRAHLSLVCGLGHARRHLARPGHR